MDPVRVASLPPLPSTLTRSSPSGFNEGTPVRKLVHDLGIKTSVPKPAPSKMYGPQGELDSALAGKLTSNWGKASAACKEAAQLLGSSNEDDSIASVLLSPESKLFEGLELEGEERALARGLARTLQVPVGATLEQTSLKWWGWESNYDGTNAAPIGGVRLHSPLARPVTIDSYFG